MTLSNKNKLNELTQAVFERFPLYQAKATQLKDIRSQSASRDFRYAFGRSVNFTFFDLRQDNNDYNFLLMIDVILGIKLSIRFFIRASDNQFLLYPIFSKDKPSHINESIFSQFLNVDLTKTASLDDFVLFCLGDIRNTFDERVGDIRIVDSADFLKDLPLYSYPPVYSFANGRPFVDNAEYKICNESTSFFKDEVDGLVKIFLPHLTSLSDDEIYNIRSCPEIFITKRLNTEIYNGFYFINERNEVLWLELDDSLISEKAILDNGGFINKGFLLANKDYKSESDDLPFLKDDICFIDNDIFRHYCDIATEYIQNVELDKLHSFTCDLNFVELRKNLIDKIKLSNKIYDSVLSDLDALIKELENDR
jgi:hypothetical protein